MNEKPSVNLTAKDAAKLLKGLTKDPQLRSEDDPSILAAELTRYFRGRRTDACEARRRRKLPPFGGQFTTS